jgi:hypothetical protein
MKQGREIRGWIRTLATREGVSEATIRARYRTARGLERPIAELVCRDALDRALALVSDDKPAPTGPSLNDWACRAYHAALWADKKKRANTEARRALAAEARVERKRERAAT